MLVPSDASALPRGWKTRYQYVSPYSIGSLFGKYQRSAKAHSSRFKSGPKIAKASNASTSAPNSVRSGAGSVILVIAYVRSTCAAACLR